MRGLKLGLIAKFTLSVFVTLIISVIALSFSHVQIERLRAEAEIINKGKALARNLAYNSEYGILSGNTEILNRLAKNAMEEDVIYVQILDNQGNILAQEQRPSSEARMFNLEVPVISLELKRPAEEIGLEPLAPAKAELKENRIGTVKIEISLARVSAMVNQLLGLIWGAALTIMLIGLLSIALSTRVLLTAPLKQFVAGTQKIARGDLIYRVKIESRDEIGELAASFNTMTAELSKARAELLGYAQGLEAKVAERTRSLETAVSTLKETTTELAAAKTGLEQKVAERTAELQKERTSLEEKVKERTKELQTAKGDLEAKVAELEEFYKLAIGRELKMIELEKEANRLLTEAGQPEKYKVV